MAFDGIALQGQALKIRRPKDYAPIPGIGGEFIYMCTCRPNDYAPIPGIGGEFINMCTCTTMHPYLVLVVSL